MTEHARTTRRTILIGTGVAAGASAVWLGARDMGSMDQYNASVAATRRKISERPEIGDLIRYATLAPSGHNTQPWRFRVGADRIEILPDLERRTAAVDPDDHHLFVSLGCAIETLALAARAHERPGEIRFDDTGDGSAILTFGGGPAAEAALFDAIPRRQSTRGDYDGRPVGPADLRALALAAETEGVDVVLMAGRAQIDQIRDLVVAGNSTQMADPAFVRELRSWLRFSPREAMATGDGLFSATSGSPVLPAWLGPHMFDLSFKAGAENDRYARQLRSSAGVAVFVSARDDRAHWVAAGRACQRFALQATALGLKVAFVNQPVEVARLRPDLAALVGLAGRRPDLVMRFGYGPALPFSARRPVDTVLA
jgi:nitroreductase